MKKSDAIRAVVSKHGDLTNRQIREEVLKRFGIIVYDNHLIQVAGKYADRMSAFGGFPPHSVKRAKEFLTFCGGDYRHAKRLLEMVIAGGKP